MVAEENRGAPSRTVALMRGPHDHCTGRGATQRAPREKACLYVLGERALMLITGFRAHHREEVQPEEEWSPCHKRAPGGLNDGGWQETAGPAGPELRYRSLGAPSWGGPPREPTATSWKAGQMSYFYLGYFWDFSKILCERSGLGSAVLG